MRNLKKLFAVIMVVAMLASIMVPAFAADYEADALKLKALGLFKGYSDTDLGLDDSLTREQGLTFMLRARGLEDEVQAMSTEEIAAQLAKVTDLDTVSEWAKPYVAYAVKNGLTKGIDASILPNIKFAGQLLLTGKEFINFMLNAMGYEEEWDNVLSKAADIGMLSAGQAVTFGSVLELKRDTAAGIISFAMSGTTASGVSLAQALVDSGAVDAAAMADAGYFTPTVAPTEAPKALTATASTDNLIQIYVEYSQEVDAASAKKAENYTVAGSKIEKVALLDDGVTVVLTLNEKRDQQDKADVKIKNVKDLEGTAISETTINVEFLDMTIPTIVDVSVAGKNMFKVVFSEPMEVAPKEGFSVNGGKLYVKDTAFDSNNPTVVYVTMYSTLKEGEVELEINNKNKDYAGFSVAKKLYKLAVVPDTEAPYVIGYEDATPTSVTLIWSEDITVVSTKLADFYHTNSKNQVKAIPSSTENKLTLQFADDSKLPEGIAYVYVMEKAIKDGWDNANSQAMFMVEVILDTTPPEILKIEQDGTKQDVIKVTYSEDVTKASAEKVENYIILENGEEVEDIIKDIEYVYDSKVATATITFNKPLGGDYILIAKNVKDLAGNANEEEEVAFTIEDKTPPLFTGFEAKVYNAGETSQIVKVLFNENMAVEGKYAVNDIEKYSIAGTALAGKTGVKIALADSNKAVEITIPVGIIDLSALNIDSADKSDNDVITVARVADAAGNYTSTWEGTVPMVEVAAVSLSAKATALNTIVLSFGDEISFDADDFKVCYTVGAEVYNVEVLALETSLVSGKTVATYTVNNKVEGKYEITHDLNGTGSPFVVIVNGDSSTNSYGQSVAQAPVNITDGIAAAYDKDSTVFATTGGTITLAFKEAIATTNAPLYAHDLVVTNGVKTTALVAGVDYTTDVVGGKIVITVGAVGDVSNYTVKTKDTITYIKGVDGNKIAGFDSTK